MLRHNRWMQWFLAVIMICLISWGQFSMNLSLKSEAATLEEVEGLLGTIPENWPAAPEIQSPCAVVVEVNSGTVLYAKNATQQWYPASVTKIMTGLLAIENGQLSDEITFSNTAIHSLPAGASNIALNTGEILTLEESLYGLLLPSANEVANGLAEYVSGDMASFAVLMNERAKELGAVNTNFVNPSGLHDDNHYSCAYDLALIFAACMRNPTFLRIDSTPTYIIQPTNLQPEQRPIGSTHQMMRKNSEYYDSDIICGKTGWTEQSGRNLVSYTSKNGLDLVIVVLGAEETPKQYEDTRTLMDYCFDNFTVANVAANDVTYSAINAISTASPITIPKQEITLFELDKEDCVVLPNEVTFADLGTSLVYESDSSHFATIRYKFEDYVVGEGHLMVDNAVLTKAEFEEVTHDEVGMGTVTFDEVKENSGWNFSDNPLFWILVIALILVLILWIVMIFRKNGRGGGSHRGGSHRNAKGTAGPDFHKSRKRRSTHIV